MSNFLAAAALAGFAVAAVTSHIWNGDPAHTHGAALAILTSLTTPANAAPAVADPSR